MLKISRHVQATIVVTRLIVWLSVIGASLALFSPVYAERDRHPVIDAIVDMTCFPPPPAADAEPGIGSNPPCPVPAGVEQLPHLSGRAYLTVRNDDTARIAIHLQGLAPDLVITAWLAYFFPPGTEDLDPIFQPIGEGLPPVAGVSVPLAPTRAGFTQGLGREPNQFILLRLGRNVHGILHVELDYNPLKSGQGPLRNELSLTNQAAAPTGTGAEQPPCCPPNGSRRQPVGASFLRAFDQITGLQLLNPDGWPVLLRSPVPAVVIAIVVHRDETTHGITAGIPIPPIPGISASIGDHYTLGLFDLRAHHLD